MVNTGKREAPDVEVYDPPDNSAHRAKRPTTDSCEMEDAPLRVAAPVTTIPSVGDGSPSSSTLANVPDHQLSEHGMKMTDDGLKAPSNSLYALSYMDIYQDHVIAPSGSAWRDMLLPGQKDGVRFPNSSALHVHEVDPQTLQFLARYTYNRDCGLDSLEEAATDDPTILDELWAMHFRQLKAERDIRMRRSSMDYDGALKWIDDDLPHLPEHVRVQMSEPESKLLQKYFAASILGVRPDFTALELVCLCFWAKGSRLTIREIIGWTTKTFPYYNEMDPAATNAALRSNPELYRYRDDFPYITGRVPIFYSPDEGMAKAGNINSLVNEVFKLNGFCYERLSKYVECGSPVGSLRDRQLDKYELIPGFEHEVFRSSGLKNANAYWASQAVSTSWANPGRRENPIGIIDLPTELQLGIFEMVFADLDGELVRISIFDDYHELRNRHREQTLAFYNTGSRETGFHRLLSPLVTLLKASQTCRAFRDVVRESFFKNTKFEITHGLPWLRQLDSRDLSTLRKLQLDLDVKGKERIMNAAMLRLIGRLCPNFNIFHGRVVGYTRDKPEANSVLARYRNGKELEISSHYRGVKPVLTVDWTWFDVSSKEEALLNKLDWVVACMARPHKEHKSCVLAATPLAESTLCGKRVAELKAMVGDYEGDLNDPALNGKPKSTLAAFVAKKMREDYDNALFS